MFHVCIHCADICIEGNWLAGWLARYSTGFSLLYQVLTPWLFSFVVTVDLTLSIIAIEIVLLLFGTTSCRLWSVVTGAETEASCHTKLVTLCVEYNKEKNRLTFKASASPTDDVIDEIKAERKEYKRDYRCNLETGVHRSTELDLDIRSSRVNQPKLTTTVLL
jgi:hypothetical protein